MFGVVERGDRDGCHQTTHSQHGQIPVVGVAEEERVLVGVGQVEYHQTHHLTHKHNTHKDLHKGGRGEN